MRLGPFLKFYRTFIILSLSSLIFSGCGEKADSTLEVTTPDPAVSAAQKNEILPNSGDITTSVAGVPTSQITQNQPPPTGSQKVRLTPKQQEQVVNQILANQAKAQAAGFGNGRVKINGAWNYKGYSTLQLDPASTIPARLVAVDLTVEGHTVNFDYDDVEIIDGDTGISYGSDPFAVFLGTDGKPLPTNQRPPVAPEAIRVLLVYAFPKATPKFSLAYWHKNILRGQTIEIADEGWFVPYPKTSGGE